MRVGARQCYVLRVEVTVVVMPVLWCSQAVARRHELTCHTHGHIRCGAGHRLWAHLRNMHTTLIVDIFILDIKARHIFDKG